MPTARVSQEKMGGGLVGELYIGSSLKDRP
jgi:hypothetical protein